MRDKTFYIELEPILKDMLMKYALWEWVEKITEVQDTILNPSNDKSLAEDIKGMHEAEVVYRTIKRYAEE